MSVRTTAMAGAAPFAHLLGLGRASAKAKTKAETEKEREDDEREGEEDRDDKAASAKTEGEEDREEEDEKPDGKKAKGKKAASEDDEEEEDEDEAEMRGNGVAAQARRRERKRCAAIFGSKAAAGIPHVAAQLAFGTTMSASAAIKVLEASALHAHPAAAAKPTLRERMEAENIPSVASGPAAKAPTAGQPGSAAAMALAAYRKATGRA